MYFANDPMPSCVPEYYRERQEERDRQFDRAMQRREHYQANRRKLDAAAEGQAGLPVLSFGGYVACRECPRADGDTQTDDEDDFCCIICHDPSCPEHMKNRIKEGSR